jgi:hypothetical protein
MVMSMTIGTMNTQSAMLITMPLTKLTRKGQTPRSRYLPKLLKSKSGNVSGRSSSRPQKPVIIQPFTTIWPITGMRTQTPASKVFIIHFGILK